MDRCICSGDRYNLEFYYPLIYKIYKEGKKWRIF